MSSLAPPVPAPAHRAGESLLPRTLALLSFLAAGIHAYVVPEHLEEYWLFGAFFVGLTLFQAGWAVTVVRRPTVPVALVGILVSFGVVLVWLLSRTAGLPIGPEPWTRESVARLDVVSGLAEAGIVALALKMCTDRTRRPMARG